MTETLFIFALVLLPLWAFGADSPALRDLMTPGTTREVLAVPVPAAAPDEELIDSCIKVVMDSTTAPAPPAPPPPPPYAPRWQKVKIPDIADDLTPDSARKAFGDTAAYWRPRPAQTVTLAGETYTGEELALGFEALSRAVNGGRGSLNRAIEESFDVYQSMRKQDNTDEYTGEGKVTGYYAPEIPVDSAQQPREVPVFRHPAVVPDDPSVPAGMQTRKVGRCQILGGALAGQGLEMYWTSPTDLMSLQTEGSGFGKLPDGSKVFLGYAGGNGRKWRGVSGALLDVRSCCMKSGSDCGLPPKAMGTRALVSFLKSQPANRELMMTCLDPSFVFFSEDHDGPKGALGVLLTAGRSVAVDRQQVPLGLPGLLSSRLPPSSSGPGAAFTRLIVTHDVGGAIKGGARVDLYWGEGPEAEAVGGTMNNPGRLYILLPRH